MKKTLLVLFAVTLFTFGCADTSEDTVPDPVVPEINIDDQKSEQETGKKVMKPRSRSLRG